MDDAVRRAMAKWPDVPPAFGWLSLDMRGQWLLQNERIGNPLLIEFIGRNYAGDHNGRWFFQNGPQRVFAALAYAPWVLRMDSEQCLITHTGRPVRAVTSAWMDREGIVTLHTEHGAGVVDDRDVESLAPWISDTAGGALDEDELIESLDRIQEGHDRDIRLRYAGRAVPLLPISADAIPAHLGFVRMPQPLPGEETGS
ncbi:MAG: DUF2946 family protein [Burkholderiales bacterium]